MVHMYNIQSFLKRESVTREVDSMAQEAPGYYHAKKEREVKKMKMKKTKKKKKWVCEGRK